GERASKLAVDTVLRYFQQSASDGTAEVCGKTFDGVSDCANTLAKSIQLANQAICEEAERSPALAGMGTTVVAVLVDKALFSVANVGDSRAYLIRGDVMQQLTQDHSLVMEHVRRGLLTTEEAEHSAIQNVIVRALGSEDAVEPDLADHELLANDLLLLCSDGLTRHVTDQAIAEILSKTSDLSHAC